MNIKIMQRACAIILSAYTLFCLLLCWIGGDNLRFQEVETSSLSAAEELEEMTKDLVLSQYFKASGDELRGISFLVSTHSRANQAHLDVVIKDDNGQVFGQGSCAVSNVQDGDFLYVAMEKPINLQKGSRYLMELSSPDGEKGSTISFWIGNSFALVRGAAIKDIPESDLLRVNGSLQQGMLCFSAKYRNYFWFGEHAPIVLLAGGLVLLSFCFVFMRKARRGQVTFLHRLVDGMQKYSFLMRQLILRDFKTKYKRSVLGVFWSFLNPLLTMSVQFIVFSKLFRSNISNFPLYLLSGIVCYNFFSEATTMSLVSIVGNAHLITKVYVPKYIYPLSRVLSSTINMLLALIPLFGVMIITGAPITPALLMLPYGILCLIGLCIGMAFFLSTSMVFFRDTQFLWGVLIMLWMYMTPIFYPESIIPEQFLPIYHCNPLYQIIHFIRALLIDGVSPEPMAYLTCFLAAVIPAVLGVLIFKKNQDKFIFNL